MTVNTDLGNTRESARRLRVEPTGGISATNTQKALEGLDGVKVPSTRLINTTAPLAGGGDLSVDRTHSITGAAGQVLAGAAPAFTATPTLGASGTFGALIFGNATSGLLTLQSVTGALGAITVSLPAATDTLVGKATTDTLTNKTYDTAGTGNVFNINGTKLVSLGATLTISGTALQTAAHTGDVTTPANSFVTTIAANVVTNAKAAQMAANTVKANNTGGTANASDLTVSQTVTMLAASEAIAEAGTNTATLNTPQGTAQAIVALTQKFKNVVGRNGGLEVWQRLTTGTTIAVPASTVAYTVDGCYLATAANQASTVTQVAGLANGSTFAARVQRNSGQTGVGAMVFAFPLDTDELAKLRGNAAVLSFTVATGANWSPASGTLTWKLYCGTGATVAKRNATPYTGESNPISGSVNLAQGAAAARQISAISAAIGSTITQAELQFTWTPVGTASTNDWFSIDDMQVEIVPTGIAAVVPLFERSDYVFDLARSQRFLPVFKNGTSTTAFYAIGQVNTTNSANFVLPFPVQARVNPTGVVISQASDFDITNSSGGGTVAASVSFTGATLQSCGVQFTVAGTPVVAGNASQLFGVATTALIAFTGAEI